MKRLSLFFWLSLPIAFLNAATYTVINTNDSGSGSLRQSIDFCNITPGPDNLFFNIPGIAPHTITPLTTLPTLVDPGTIVDGTTQPANGYVGTGKKIILNGNNGAGNGITITGINIVIRGLFIRDFSYTGIQINGSANGFVIGGINAGNTISGNGYYGIYIDGADNGSLIGSFVGTNDAGTAAMLNDYAGVSLSNSSNGNTIGGTTAGSGNVISGNGYWGLEIECSSNNIIKGNFIGTDVTGTISIPNEYDGIKVHFGGPGTYLCNCQNNIIGGINAGEGNIVANNLYRGINVCGTNVNYNTMRGNSVFCNNYTGIGLEDGNYGQPNGNNNYASPVITVANIGGASGTSIANDFIDIYIDDNCGNCEPRTYVGSSQASGAGTWSYTGVLSGSITAIATSNTNGNSSKNSTCVFVSAGAAPSANFTATATQICGSGCIDFTDLSTGTPTSWLWSFPGATPNSSTDQHPLNICYPSPSVYSVSLSATNAFGTGNITQNTFITVTAIPVANAGNNVSICAGGNTQLQGAGGGTYSWSPGGTLSNPAISNPIATPGNTTNYILTVDVSGCTDSDTVSVVVNQLPNAGADTTINICEGDTITISAMGGGSYQWSPTGGLASPTSGTTLAFPSNTTIYSCLVTDGNGCQDTKSVTINVNPIPVAGADTTISICEGDTVLISASGGTVYQWSPTSGLATPNQSSTFAFPTSTTTYTCAVSNAGGCSDEIDVNIIVNPLPTPVITQVGNILSSTPGTSYQWYLNGNPIAGATNQSYTATQNGDYSVLVTNNDGCKGFSNVISFIIDALEERPTFEFVLFPNPAVEKIFVSFYMPKIVQTEYKIYSSFGFLVREGALILNDKNNTVEISLNGLTPGTYFFKVSDCGFNTGKAFVIN